MNGRRLTATMGLWVLLVTALLAEKTSGQPAPADQGTLWQELVERVLMPPHPGPGGPAFTVQLLPGHLPRGLPVDLPLPAGSRLVGSIIHSVGEKAAHVEIVLDVPGPEPAVRTFYETELSARGWQATVQGPPPGAQHGFQAPAIVMASSFCQSPQGPWLMLTSALKPPGPTDVRLSLQLDTPGPCMRQSLTGGSLGPPPADTPIPSLTAPEGVQLRMAGGGGGPGRWTQEASAETEQRVAPLEAHFAQQLQAAGWSRLAGQEDGPLAWSTWKVPGEGEWQGFLLVREVPGVNQRALHIEVNSTAPPSGATGFWGAGWGRGGR
jgi:hypothetical protein